MAVTKTGTQAAPLFQPASASGVASVVPPQGAQPMASDQAAAPSTPADAAPAVGPPAAAPSSMSLPQTPAVDAGKTWGNPSFTRPLNFGHRPGPDGQLIKWHPTGHLVWGDNGKALSPDQWVCMPPFQQEALKALMPPAQRDALVARLQQGQASRATRPEPSAEEAAAPSPSAGTTSADGANQAQALLAAAKSASAGRRPDGLCYAHVWKFIEQVGYGKFPKVGIPDSHSAYARNFAELVNQDPARYGLRRLNLSNPYDAPAGAIVVVGPGSPGTAHPTAGDIAVSDGQGRFFNGGEMGYGGRHNFPPGNRHLLGVYLPA